MTAATLLAQQPLAQQLLAQQQSGQAGPIGLLVLVLLGIAVVLLIRNMDRRIKNLPREFPRDEEHDPRVPPPR